jgi:hypothetical protein
MMRSGSATIAIERRIYVADTAVYDGAAVSFTGRLRVRDLLGDRLYEPVTMTVPIARVERITWHGERS